MLTLNLLGVFLANRVLLRLDMTIVGSLAIGVIVRDAKRFQQRFQLQKDGVFAAPEYLSQHLPRVVVYGMPKPPRIRFAVHVA